MLEQNVLGIQTGKQTMGAQPWGTQPAGVPTGAMHMGGMQKSGMQMSGMQMGAMPMEMAQHMAHMAAMQAGAQQMGKQFGIQPAAQQQVGATLLQTLRMIEAAMPIHETMHSLHTQAELDPNLRGTQSMRRFAEVAERNLHSAVAVAGYIRRILSGDVSQLAVRGLQDQVRTFQQTQADTRTALSQLVGTEQARTNEAVRSMSQVFGLAEQAARAVMGTIQPLLTVEVPATTTPTTAPMTGTGTGTTGISPTGSSHYEGE